jgi:hypothetical protein
MELSTAASFTAAAISLVTLVVTTYFTGRRERVKRAREALTKAFYDFVNASYMASQALHHHQKQLWAGADGSSLQASADEVNAQILALRYAQTKIRLLPRVGARNSAILRDLQIFVDGSAESVTTNDLGVGCFGLGECS